MDPEERKPLLSHQGLRRRTRGSAGEQGKDKAKEDEERKKARSMACSVPLLSFTLSMLNPRSKRPTSVAYRWTIVVLTGLSVVCFLLETVPAIDAQPALSTMFDILDGFVSCVFLLDFGLRLWTAPYLRRYSAAGLVVGRLQWLVSWESIFLGIATFPYFVDLLDGHQTLLNFGWLRIFRIFLLFRTSQFGQSVGMVVRVIFVNRSVLIASLTFIVFMLLITASLLYCVADEATRSSNELTSIPSSLYLATLMLVGQAMPEPPDGQQLSWGLHVVVVLTAFLSVPFFASNVASNASNPSRRHVPAGMLVWGFEGEAARLAARERRRLQRLHVYGEREQLVQSTTEEDSSDMDDYVQGIGGGSDDASSEAEEAALAFFAENGDSAGASGMPPLVLLPRAKHKAAQLRARRKQAATHRQQRADALQLLRRAGELDGGDMPAGSGKVDDSDELPATDEQAAELEQRLQQFAANLRRADADAGVQQAVAESPADATRQVDNELRAEVAALRADVAGLASAIAQIARRLDAAPAGASTPR